MIVLTLPYPVSSNAYWRSFIPPGHKRPVVTLSREAKAYKAEVRKLAMLAGVRKPIAGRVSVDLALYPKRPQDWERRARKDPETWDDDVQCIDLDNARKVLYDSMKGVVFEDDGWVFEDAGRRMEPDGEARVVVTVRPIVVRRAQADLLGEKV